MTLPANIRVNARVPFPALVTGAGFVTVTKQNGIWTVGVDYTLLAQQLTIPNPTQKLVAIYDTVAKQYNTTPVSVLLALAIRPQRSIASAADLPIEALDSILNSSITAPLAVTIPAASTLNGAPLLFQDVAGTWGANNMTFNRTGTDQFDGQNSLVGKINYGWIEFTPINDGVNNANGYKVRGIYQ